MSDAPIEESAPIQDGATEATREEKIRGILMQVQEDLRQGHAHDRESLLRQRLDEAGIDVADDDLRQYLD